MAVVGSGHRRRRCLLRHHEEGRAGEAWRVAWWWFSTGTVQLQPTTCIRTQGSVTRPAAACTLRIWRSGVSATALTAATVDRASHLWIGSTSARTCVLTFKTRNFVLETRNFVSKTRNCVLKMKNFADRARGCGVLLRGQRARRPAHGVFRVDTSAGVHAVRPDQRRDGGGSAAF